MEYIQLRNSDIEASRLGFGGCPMGGYGWGRVDRKQIITAIHEAIDAGLNFFDTADVYGLGEGEKTLGEALGRQRHKVVIATKFGVRLDSNKKTFYDNSPEWIEKALEGSLKRLNTDYIDLYQIHYRDGRTPLHYVVEKLNKLKQNGYIRYFGLSNVQAADVDELFPYKDEFVSFQDEYSLANRRNEHSINSIFTDMKITPMTWGSLGQGILTGKYDRNTIFHKSDRRSRGVYVNFHGEKLDRNLQVIEVMKGISRDINRSLPAIAIRWILDKLPGSIVLTGIKNRIQLKNNIESQGWTLNDEQIELLNRISGE